MADRGPNSSAFHYYSRLPVELQLDIVQRGLGSLWRSPSPSRIDFSALAVVDRVFQQVAEEFLFRTLEINDSDIANFDQFCVGRRRSILERLVFTVHLDNQTCDLDCDLDLDQQNRLLPVQSRDAATEPSLCSPDTKQSASELVTIAYTKLFRSLATWSPATDRAALELVYMFECTDRVGTMYLDQINVDITDIPLVTVIRRLAHPRCILRDHQMEVDWYLPSLLRLLRRMHRLESCEMSWSHLLQGDGLPAMQAVEGKSSHHSRPVFLSGE